MDAVKAFNAELSALYDVKPPISKAKMNSLTRGAIKAIKFYKHVVQSVEKFIQKCKPEYKVPGLYVIDSIVRQSRHQFGLEKDVFAPRFAKNMQTTFLNLLKCPPEDKSKVIRVLNLWQKNAVFPSEVIQPLFDLADPNHPIHKEPVNSNGTLNTSANNATNASVNKTPPSGIKNATKDQKLFSSAKTIDPVWLAQTKMETANIVNANKLLGQANPGQMDASFLEQLQQLQQLLLKKQEAEKTSVKFDKKLLDFDYGEEEDDDVMVAASPAPAHGSSLESLGLLLTNPEVLRQLQTLQQTMQGNAGSSQLEMEEKMRKLQQMKQQEEEFDKHLAQTVPNLPFASECELKPPEHPKGAQGGPYTGTGVLQDLTQPPPGYPPALPYAPQLGTAGNSGQGQGQGQGSPGERREYDGNGARRDSSSVEIVNCDSARSVSRSPDRYRHHSRSRSPRHRDRERDRERERKRERDRERDRERESRSGSRGRRRRSRSRDRGRDRKREDSREKMTEEEREKERERRKRGLPPIVRDKLSVCSTTLWVGHLSKLVHQEELSDTFGEFGDIVSIDLISPRGCAFICMNRRQDAYRALTKLKSHKMQGKAITLAWAPGKGVKGKEWKDYWEVELGVSYIPWNKLINVTDQDLELLEEGGMIDEDTLPPNLKGKLKHSVPPPSSVDSTQQPLLQLQLPLEQGAGPVIDTSQPPPARPPTSALLPPPAGQIVMGGAFSMPGVPRMLGPMGLPLPPLLPNVPLGVPPPSLPSLLPPMMQPMLTPPVNSFGLLAQIPLPAPEKGVRYGGVEDMDMDVEMEEEGEEEREEEERRDFKSPAPARREGRDRDSNERRLDGGRDRGRGRERGRDRRRERDERERRERENRENREGNGQTGMQENEGTPKKEKPPLAERLRQLADGTLPLEDRPPPRPAPPVAPPLAPPRPALCDPRDFPPRDRVFRGRPHEEFEGRVFGEEGFEGREFRIGREQRDDFRRDDRFDPRFERPDFTDRPGPDFRRDFFDPFLPILPRGPRHEGFGPRGMARGPGPLMFRAPRPPHPRAPRPFCPRPDFFRARGPGPLDKERERGRGRKSRWASPEREREREREEKERE